MELTEIELGRFGVDYIASTLQKATGMCRDLLQLPLTTGSTYAPLPLGTSLHRAHDLNAGGIASWDTTIEWLAAHAMRSFSGRAGTIVILDAWAKPSDIIDKSTFGLFSTNDNVYYILHRDECTPGRVIAAANNIMSFIFIAILSDFPIVLNPGAAQREISRHIGMAARGTREIFVSAYDREGIVVWRR